MMRNLLSLSLAGLLATALLCGPVRAAEPETGDAAKAPDSPAAQPSAAAAKGGQVPSAETRAKAQTQSMAKVLGLDEEQTKKVEAINLKFVEGMQGLRTSTKRGPERMEEARKLQGERTQAIKGVLTKEQLEKYESATGMMRQKRRAKRQNQG